MKQTLVQFEPITEHIQRSRDERRQHLRLTEKCVEIGGASGFFKGLLAHHLKTTIPFGLPILLCHACHNPGCSNPNHLYWGTHKDNWQDANSIGATPFGNSKHHQSVAVKRTKEYLENARKMGKEFGGQNKLDAATRHRIETIILEEPKSWGWKQRVAKKLGVSHTQVSRYVKQFRLLSSFG
jgi:hypothetical protein